MKRFGRKGMTVGEIYEDRRDLVDRICICMLVTLYTLKKSATINRLKRLLADRGRTNREFGMLVNMRIDEIIYHLIILKERNLVKEDNTERDLNNKKIYTFSLTKEGEVIAFSHFVSAEGIK